VALTGTPFQRRFNENLQSFRNYNSNSRLAQHLHEMEHSKWAYARDCGHATYCTERKLHEHLRKMPYILRSKKESPN
jgi:hypothetical protein